MNSEELQTEIERTNNQLQLLEEEIQAVEKTMLLVDAQRIAIQEITERIKRL